MQHKTVVQVPARTEERVTHTTCDICGKDPSEDETLENNVAEVTIESRVGWSYGSDGCNIEFREFDCCRTCFNKHVVPLFKGFDAEPESEK